MTLSSTHQRLIPDCKDPVADVLVVGLPAELIGALEPEMFSRANSGREALGMMKLLRFHLLLASLDVPDMRPWELFHRARRAQARLQCVLLDERLSLDDEQHVRQAGASAFASNEPGILASILKCSPRLALAKFSRGNGEREAVTSEPLGPARAPP